MIFVERFVKRYWGLLIFSYKINEFLKGLEVCMMGFLDYERNVKGGFRRLFCKVC